MGASAGRFTGNAGAAAQSQPPSRTLPGSAAESGRDSGGTPLQLKHFTGTILAALAAAALIAQGALAGGEPKNEWPFTRPADTRSTQAVRHSTSSNPVIQGEPKNEWPFTRPADTRSTQGARHSTSSNPVIQGEPKNEPPFTRPVIVVAGDRNGFSWRDSALGGLGGVGITLAGAGALLATRKSPRTA